MCVMSNICTHVLGFRDYSFHCPVATLHSCSSKVLDLAIFHSLFAKVLAKGKAQKPAVFLDVGGDM